MTSIGTDCFNNLTSFTSIKLPLTLRSIGESTFYKTHLSTVTIPEGGDINWKEML